MQRTSGTPLAMRPTWSPLALLPLLAALLLAACSAPPANTGTLYVAPGGDDASGTGTVGAPYKTLTAAVNAAPAGSTIVIADGDYSAASGETFPLDVSGLTLRGQSAAGTTVNGTSAALYGLTIAGGATTVSDLTVTGFSTTTEGANVRISSGTALLEDVIVSDGAHRGISIEGGTVTLRSVAVSGSRDDNVYVRGSAALEGGQAAQLDDERAPGATLIPAVGNDFGVAVNGIQTGPDKLGFVWSIEGAGNQIDFGP